MWHIRTILAGVAGILLLCVFPIHADSLQLKNGNFVQGKYLGGTERAVQFEVNGKIHLYDVGEILSISFAAASADGGIPSNNAEPKPNANTELNSKATNNRGVRAAGWKQVNGEIRAVQIARQPELYSRRADSRADSPCEPSGSSRASEPNPQAKARVSAIDSRSIRISPTRLPILFD